MQNEARSWLPFLKVTAGLNERPKLVPQVCAADRKVHAKNSVFTCEQQLHELMA